MVLNIYKNTFILNFNTRKTLHIHCLCTNSHSLVYFSKHPTILLHLHLHRSIEINLFTEFQPCPTVEREREREREQGEKRSPRTFNHPSRWANQPIIKPRLPIIRISCRSIERSQRLRLHQEARLAKSHAQETTPTTSGASSRTGPWKTVVFLRNEARRSVFLVTTIDRCARSITSACILRERRQGSRT